MAVQMETVQLDARDSAKFASLMVAVGASPDKATLSESHYKMQARAGVALLLDPVNGNPSVFVAPSTLTKFSFPSVSGTDHLRARSQAQMFFDRVVEQAEKAVPFCLRSLTPSQRDAVQDALANWDSSSDADIAQAWSEMGLSEEQCQAALTYRDRFLTEPMFQLWPVGEAESSGPTGTVRTERQR